MMMRDPNRHLYVCMYARRRRARARPNAMSRWATATATATRRPWTCATVIAAVAVACGVGALVGGLARFDPPRAREWVIAKDEATTRADAGEAAVAMSGECVDVVSSRSRARGGGGGGRRHGVWSTGSSGAFARGRRVRGDD